MAKKANVYLQVDPWKVVEVGFHKDRSKVSESIFSLGNEYMGVRGFFDEGGEVESLKGTYFNGVYEYAKEDTPIHYKGIVQRTHFMINSVDWLKTKIIIDGNILDLGKVNVENFKRVLDFKSGLYTREFTWVIDKNKHVNIKFERLLSMVNCYRGFQRITFNTTFDATLDLTLSLDSTIIHWGKDCYWNFVDSRQVDDNVALLCQTLTTKQRLLSLMHAKVDNVVSKNTLFSDKRIDVQYKINLKAKQDSVVERYVSNIVEKKIEVEAEKIFEAGLKDLELSKQEGYFNQLEKNRSFWSHVWDHTDIEINGDEKNQQGIRFCIFQLQQTYHGFSPFNNIGAKGLTGEAYSGHAFWDTETYCLPYYLLNNKQAAKNLLMYRYYTLEMAKKRAIELDCEGACYPIATLNGYEACNLWQHASLQFQPTSAVAYGIYHYVKLTDDLEFLKNYGFEMLLEICRFLLTRGQWNQNHTHFSYYCVMGPDEFQMMVNHNTYTNYMAKRTFEYTLKLVEQLKDSVNFKQVLVKTGVNDSLLAKFKEAADKMYILYDEKTKLYEQHDGFFDLPHIDVDSIPVEDFPLYSHWSYDRIYRNDMIKQPDVLMFMFLFNQSFPYEVKKINYEYYEPKCIHESSLSPSIHSIFASELGKDEEALNFFGFATRMDLDDFNRNTNEGLHTTSIAAAWVNIVYGFGGLRSDGDVLVLKPSKPAIWKDYSFKFNYHDALIKVKVTAKQVEISNLSGKEVELEVYDKRYLLKDNLLIDRG